MRKRAGHVFFIMWVSCAFGPMSDAFSVEWSQKALELVRRGDQLSDIESVPFYEKAAKDYLYQLVPVKDACAQWVCTDMHLYQTVGLNLRLKFPTWPENLQAAFRKRVQKEAEEALALAAAREDASELTLIARKYFATSVSKNALSLASDLYFREGKFIHADFLIEEAIQSDPMAADAEIEAKRLLIKAAISPQEIDTKKISQFKERFPDIKAYFAARNSALWKNLEEALAEDGWATASSAYAPPKGLASYRPSKFVFKEKGLTRRLYRPAAPQLSAAQSKSPYGLLMGRGELWLTSPQKLLKVDLDELKMCQERNKDGCTATQIHMTFDAPPKDPFSTALSSDRLFYLNAYGVSAIHRIHPERTFWHRSNGEIFVSEEALKEAKLLEQGYCRLTESLAVDSAGLYFLCLTGGGFSEPASVFLIALDPNRGLNKWSRYLGTHMFLPDLQVKGHAPTLKSYEGRLYFRDWNGDLSVLEAETGVPCWTVSFGNQEEASSSLFTAADDRTLIEEGRVIGISGDHAYALDAGTGRLLWWTPVERAQTLLGLSQGKLFVAGEKLWSIDVRSGKLIARFPEKTAIPFWTSGRGALIEGEVIWPTNQGLFRLDQKTLGPIGRPLYVEKFINHTRDELVADVLTSDEVLIIAFPEEVLVHFNHDS